MDYTTLNPKTGQNFRENGSRYYAMARGYGVLSEHLKQKVLNYGFETSYLEITSSFRLLSLDKYRENADKPIPHRPKIFFSPIHVKNKLSKEVYEFAVKDPEVDANKIRVCDINAKGNHSYNCGLVDLGCRHHNHEKKES